jgi:hypothetical protein
VLALARATAVDLELRLARAAAADAAGEARHRGGHHGEARHAVAELRELDLELAFAARGVLREDVEDELRAVEHLEVGGLGDVAQLRGRELAIEDQHVRAEVHAADDQLLQLALADARAAVELIPLREDLLGYPEARGLGEAGELVEAAQRALAVSQGDADEDRAGAAGHAAQLRAARELGLEVGDPLVEVVVPDVHAVDGVDAHGLAAGLGRHQVRVPHAPGQAVVQHLHGDDRVELQQAQVGPILVRQPGVGPELGVDEAHAAEAPGARAARPEVGDVHPVGISDDHLLDLAGAVDHERDPTPGLARQLGEAAGEGRRDELGARDAAGVEVLERAGVLGPKALGVAVDFQGASSARRSKRTCVAGKPLPAASRRHQRRGRGAPCSGC